MLAGLVGAASSALAISLFSASQPVWPYALAGAILGAGGAFGGETLTEAVIFTILTAVMAGMFYVSFTSVVWRCVVLCAFFGVCSGKIVYGIYKDIAP